MKRRTNVLTPGRGESWDLETAIRKTGGAWLLATSTIEKCNPAREVWVKSITIRFEDMNMCFIVIRGAHGADDVVMMRQVYRPIFAIREVWRMLRHGKWKPDRYGIQGNICSIDDQ